jgi:Uma2 family endonuclease
MLQTPNQTETLTLELPNLMASPAFGKALHVTQAQFEALASANRDLRLERSSVGELIVNPPTGGETGYFNIKISYFLVKWVEEEGGNGIPFDSSTGFRLPNGATRSPDAAWVDRERWESLTPQQRKGFLPLCPDFVVELRSPSDNLSELQTKLLEYLDNGVRLGWLIDPQNRRVEIYRPGRDVEVWENPTELSGGDVLPGFILGLGRLWT